MIAVDTNLLVYAHREAQPENQAAWRALDKACAHAPGWGIALPCIAEFWSVVTHPGSPGGASTAEQAYGFLAALIEAEAAIWQPGEHFWNRLTRLAADLGVKGPHIFDLQIALTAFENGASELWTHDAGFVTIPGLRVYDPL